MKSPNTEDPATTDVRTICFIYFIPCIFLEYPFVPLGMELFSYTSFVGFYDSIVLYQNPASQIETMRFSFGESFSNCQAVRRSPANYGASEPITQIKRAKSFTSRFDCPFESVTTIKSFWGLIMHSKILHLMNFYYRYIYWLSNSNADPRANTALRQQIQAQRRMQHRAATQGAQTVRDLYASQNET